VSEEAERRFTARPRQNDTRNGLAPPTSPDNNNLGIRSTARLTDEVARLRGRFERAARNGRDAFVRPDSDTYDIGMLAVIHLADLVSRPLPEEIAETLPTIARDGLRATRNIAAQNYAGLDNTRLWETVTTHAPALLDGIDAALRSAPPAT